MTTRLSNLDEPRTRVIAALAGEAAWPSVTLLLDTTPRERMSTRDAARLAELVDEAAEQLRDRGAFGSGQLHRELRSLAAQANREPTARGLVLLVNQAVQRSYRLPRAVGPRVVVERTFRTRELVETMHRTPPHLMLVLTSTCAQLYRLYADTMTPVSGGGFPVQLVAQGADALLDGSDIEQAHLAAVDRELTVYRRRHPSPLILAGDPVPVGHLVRHSRHLSRLAGVITGPERHDPAALYLAAKASLEEYLRSREQEARSLLEDALRETPERVFTGAEACWEAVRRTYPLMLVVEIDLEGPATPGRSDLVDDLIETVIDRGGWIAFADRGRLEHCAGVALVTRREPAVPGSRRS